MKRSFLTILCILALVGCNVSTEDKNSNSKESPTAQSNTYNFDSLIVVNNGLVEEDLEIISSNPLCQAYKDNAYKVDFELTNNFDKQINFTGKSFSDIWDTTSMMTTKMSEFTYAELIEMDNIENSGVMTPQIKDEICFEQQNQRINLQPGESTSYPLYFSVPENLRYEDETVTLVLSPSLHDYSDPTNTIIFDSENIELIEFKI